MANHVAVLRDLRSLRCQAEKSADRSMPVSVDGFDAIIAAVAERDALVARLGELEKEIRWLAGNNNPKCHLRWADTLARVVKSTATQTSSKKSGDD